MTDLGMAIGRLLVGDIFHASCSNGASLICLVESIADGIISARTVTHQLKVQFDCSNGLELGRETSSPCRIDSIAPLPVETYNVILGLDRKMRLELDILKHQLTEEEKRALVFIASYYRETPL